MSVVSAVSQPPKYDIKPREWIPKGKESPAPLQCSKCGGFFPPCKFIVENRIKPDGKTVGRIRRNFCRVCPENENLKDPVPKKKKYTYSELQSRIYTLEQELKEQDADMAAFAKTIKNLTSRIALLESSRDTVEQEGLETRRQKYQPGGLGPSTGHSMLSFDS